MTIDRIIKKHKDLYNQLKWAKCELDSHESDLYVKCSPTAEAIIEDYEIYCGHTIAKDYFVSAIDGQPWIDLPFMFTPWWDARCVKAVK